MQLKLFIKFSIRLVRPLFISLLTFYSSILLAQNPDNSRILDLFSSIVSETDDIQKIKFNDSLIIELNSYIQSEDVFTADIPGLKYLGQITSADSLLKVYSWNIPLYDGSSLYNCLIYNKKTNNSSFMQSKQGENIAGNKEIIAGNKWYGALYYDIQPIISGNDTLYILLGIDMNPYNYNTKIIEILSFSDTHKIILGNKIIEREKDLFSRLLFRYSPRASMMMKFDESRKRIVFDHLSPFSPEFLDQYQYYGPDFTYDALEFIDGRMIFIEDVDLRNEE